MTRHPAGPTRPLHRATFALAACIGFAFGIAILAVRIPAFGDDLRFASGMQPVQRWLAIAGHLLLSSTLAALTTRRAREWSARWWILLVLLANPAAHSLLTAGPTAFSAAQYVAWAVADTAAVFALRRFAGPATHPRTRAAASVGMACLAGMGFLHTAAMLRSYEMVTRPLAALAAARPKHALVLNMPSLLAPPHGGPATAVTILPPAAQLEQATGATFAQMIEGRVGAPGGVNALRAEYGDQLRLNHAEWLERAASHDAILLGPTGQFVGTVSDRQPGVPWLAEFRLADSRMRLIALRACKDPSPRVETTWERISGDAARGKLFRHALMAGRQVAQDDTVLLGDMLEFAEIAPSQRVHDIAHFSAAAQGLTQVRIGVYDWQTGERWLASRADGSQWPENAVTMEVDARCS